jgi:WD40 repeat protein
MRAGMGIVCVVEFLWAECLPGQQPPANSPPTRDCLGDPLPDGAVARLGTTRLWHEEASAVSLSPHGEELITLGVRRDSTDSPISTLRSWDAATGRLLRELRFPHHRLTAWAACPDGKRLALGVDDAKGRRIALWDLANQEEIDGPLMKHIWRITYVAFLPDGKTLVSRDDGDHSFRFWDVATRKQLRNVIPIAPRKKTYTKNASALSRDGSRSAWYIKTYGEDSPGKLGLVDGELIQVVEDGQKKLFQLDGPFKGNVRVAMSPDGKRFAWASDRENPQVIDLSRNETIASVDLDYGYTTGLTFSPDGKILACQVGVHGGHLLQLWDVEKNQALRTLFVSADEREWQFPLAFSADSQSLAVSAGGVTRIYSATTGKERFRVQGHRAPVRQLFFLPDERSLISEDDGAVCLWERETRAHMHFRASPEIRPRPDWEGFGLHRHNQGGDDEAITKPRPSHGLYSRDLTRKVIPEGIVLDVSVSPAKKVCELQWDGIAPYGGDSSLRTIGGSSCFGSAQQTKIRLGSISLTRRRVNE